MKAGDTVTWTNEESVDHDVTADDGSFKSGRPGGMKQGDTYEHTFKKAGSFAYKCTVHPNMTGTVEVTHVGPLRRRTPKPRNRSSAVSPSPPRAGSSPSCAAAS